MDQIEFHSILDFAIEREHEAVDFYHNLQKSTAAKFSAHKEMLQEIENMEKGHILILEKMRQKKMIGKTVTESIDLKLSDYLVVDEDIQPDSYQNILLIAMKREEIAKKLYLDLAERLANDDEDLFNLFQQLAKEESGHKLKFEKLYDEYVMKDN
jgi:rubrerythrin